MHTDVPLTIYLSSVGVGSVGGAGGAVDGVGGGSGVLVDGGSVGSTVVVELEGSVVSSANVEQITVKIRY